jgi:hypothetical protein
MIEMHLGQCIMPDACCESHYVDLFSIRPPDLVGWSPNLLVGRVQSIQTGVMLSMLDEGSTIGRNSAQRMTVSIVEKHVNYDTTLI